MPANGTVKSDSALDSRANYMTGTFLGGKNDQGQRSVMSFPHCTAGEVRLCAGAEPSKATMTIPLAAALDEVAPSVTFQHGPADVPIGCPSGVFGNSGGAAVGLLIGSVVDAAQNLENDGLVTETVDDRWLLEGCQIHGSFWVDPSDTSHISYREGWPMHVNPRGIPNMTFASIGGNGTYIPVMCPPNYGLSNGEDVPDANNVDVISGKKSTYWRLCDLLDAMRFAFSADALAFTSDFPEYHILPSRIIWPLNLRSAIRAEDINNFNAAQSTAQATGQRKGREMIFEGMTLLAALQALCRAAGPYALYMSPKSVGSGSSMTFKNLLQIVPTTYTGGGITLSKPSSGNAEDGSFESFNIVTSGNYGESGRSLYTKLTYAGELIYIEERVASQRTSNGGTYGLKTAYDSERLTALQNAVMAAINASDYDSVEAAIESLCLKVGFEKVLAAWRLSETFDFQDGTSETGFPIAKIGRPILPHQLTSSVEGDGTTSYAKYSLRSDVYVEYSFDATTDSDGTWAPAPRADGFALDADGTFYLKSLRTQKLTYRYAFSGSISGRNMTNLVITPAAIRINAAIPCDHRLSTSFKINSDPSEGVRTASFDNDDQGRIDEDLSRAMVADAQQLYRYEIRAAGSYPSPASVGGTAPGSAILQDDSKYIRDACERRLKEVSSLQRTGRLIVPHLNFAFVVGQAIKDIKDGSGNTFPIRAVIQAITYHAVDGVNLTELELVSN